MGCVTSWMAVAHTRFTQSAPAALRCPPIADPLSPSHPHQLLSSTTPLQLPSPAPHLPRLPPLFYAARSSILAFRHAIVAQHPSLVLCRVGL
mmetsp:Transcript_17218/g.52061  ORF Transcript_17218/g.52061 Transcript_17218/m.52061 type:complete len:92 (+) Transcript_17218:2905-3180(+)